MVCSTDFVPSSTNNSLEPVVALKRRLEAVEQRAGDSGMEYLDIPAFLRRQAD
jgi:hypothetical protein